jgi:hypothetical protein
MDAPAIEPLPRGTKRHAGSKMKNSKKEAILKLATNQHQATYNHVSSPMPRHKVIPAKIESMKGATPSARIARYQATTQGSNPRKLGTRRKGNPSAYKAVNMPWMMK